MMDFIAGLSSYGDKIRGKSKDDKIGEKGPGGGIIFAVEDGGIRYFEVSHILGEYTWDDAVKVAKNYKGGGFTDWRLPTKYELNQVYVNLKKNGLVDLGRESHWSSSSEGSNGMWSRNYMWFQDFTDGSQFSAYKPNTHSVRAVRAFTP